MQNSKSTHIVIPILHHLVRERNLPSLEDPSLITQDDKERIQDDRMGFWRNQTGVSLIESLLVVVIIGSVVTLIASIPNSLMLISKSRYASIAREIASKQIEDKRIISYFNLVNDNSAIVDSRLSLLPAASGTVTTEDCDPKICTNGEHIKVVTVTVNWLDNNPQSITLKTMIGEGGINQ